MPTVSAHSGALIRSSGGDGVNSANASETDALLRCWYIFRSGALVASYGCHAHLEQLLSQQTLQAAERTHSSRVVSYGPRVFLDLYYPPRWHSDAAESWCTDARRCLNIPNAGGASVQSEVMAVQYFHDRWGSRKFLLEMEVDYILKYKMCDFVATIHGSRVGVSVTRAFTFPDVHHITPDHAIMLLRKKLSGLVIASACVSEKHAFATSILHILVASLEAGRTVVYAYEKLVEEEDLQTDIDDEVRIRDVIVIVTVCPVLTDVVFATSKTVKDPRMMRPFGPPQSVPEVLSISSILDVPVVPSRATVLSPTIKRQIRPFEYSYFPRNKQHNKRVRRRQQRQLRTVKWH